MTNEPDVSSFRDVRAEELAAIATRRTLHRREGAADLATSLVGLALSGGGVRSATFSLGVLQAFHALGHLAKFDYLSTVSGGGFVGAWWTTWLSRREFLASHIVDEEALAADLIRDLGPPNPPVPGAPAVGELQAALAAVTSAGDREDLGAARQRLRGLLVAALNALTRAGRTTNDVFARYGSALTRLFPADEQLEPERASDYRDPETPDGALAAGRDPIHHLRLFANYLTPRTGLMSVDTWRAAAVVSRNLIFTWCVLLPILLAVVLAAQMYFIAQPFDHAVADRFLDTPPGGLGTAALWDRAAVAARVPVALVVGMLVAALLWIGVNHAGSRWTHAAAMVGGTLIVAGAVILALRPDECRAFVDCAGALWPTPDEEPSAGRRWANRLVVAAVVFGVGLIAADILYVREPTVAARARRWYHPLSIAAGVVAFARGLVAIVVGPELVASRLREPVYRQVVGNQATRWHGRLLSTLTVAVVIFAFAGFAHEAIAWLLTTHVEIGKTVATVTAVATFVGSLFTALKASPSAGRDGRDGRPGPLSTVVFSATPPLVLLVLAAAMAWLGQRLLAYLANEGEALEPILNVMAHIGIATCLVYGVRELRTTVSAAAFRVLVVGLVFAALGVVWLAVRDWQVWDLPPTQPIVYGVGAALTWIVVGWASWHLGRHRWRPAVLIGFCAAALTVLLLGSIFVPDAEYLATTAGYTAATVLIIVVAWIIIVGWLSDPNALGLHTFYKARLVRAYLGASNSERYAVRSEIHDAVIRDDMPLASLDPTRSGGPYHLINSTLNLVGGRDLVTAQRSAAYFLLSPKFCGSVRTGYRPTGLYMDGKLSVGAAVATSGAAASPNMGSRTPSAALAMLLTLFNVRLGLWVPTPHQIHWRTPQARLWPFYLLRESFSQTNDLGSYCYLTDGGHFDNTGLYSLVERACRTIVLVDNGADPKPPSFEDLGETIRRCRIDFGAEIDLTVTAFRDGRPAPAHYAVGTVSYAPVHLRALGIERDEMDGRIVWIKPALVGGEPADVVQYGFKNPVFPQQATSDQWFDEAQFESYRQLALESVRTLLEEQPAIFDAR